MLTRLLAVMSLATIAWLLIDESNYRRLRSRLRARFGGDASSGIERLRDEAAETADELRAVTLSAAGHIRGN
ncbi:MAG: hypothetical protein EPO22_06640 [Dehalococcoidia bacterium]|nr:MAG: hypothetical protein EPO22_06640 [Dehalococcoidia bacterium]